MKVIINGGEPLNGCPKDWDEAKKIEDGLNKDKDDDNKTLEPCWSFDCGFKLDYDGPILSISSRFYPPKQHYGPTWDGKVKMYFMGNVLFEKSFDCKTLDELKTKVDEYINSITESIKNSLKL
jgi:hypothetical protein